MTYETERKKVGREPCYVLKLELDSGDLYFCEPRQITQPQLDGNLLYQQIKPQSVSITPAKIEFESLGELGKASITLVDEPLETGTFWGIQLATDPYYLNRKAVLYSGYIVDNQIDLTNFEARAFTINSIDGPDSNNNVKITLKTPFVELLDKRNLAPLPDDAELDAAITDSATSLTVSPAGTIASWPATGKVVINEEIIEYTGKSGDDLTPLVRAQNNTVAAEHDAGDAIQQGLEFENAALYQVIETLIDDYTNIDSSFKDGSQWAQEVSTWLNADRLDRFIGKPTPVEELISSAVYESLAVFFFDEKIQKFQLKAIAPKLGGTNQIDETNNIVAGSQRVKRDLKHLATRVYVHYGKRNPLEDDKAENYAKALLKIDSTREGSGAWNMVKIKEIYCNWISDAGAATAIKLATRTLARFGDGLVTYEFTLDAGDNVAPWLSDVVLVDSTKFQDATGANSIKNMQILKAHEVNGDKVKYLATLDVFSGGADGSRYGAIAPNGTPDYTSATDEQKSKYVFISNNTPEMTNGDDPYLII